MAYKYTKLLVDNLVLSKYGKSLYRLVEHLSTPGLSYTKYQSLEGGLYFYRCTGVGTAVAYDLVIADTVEGILVNEIANRAFENVQTIQNVIIPDSVTLIGEGAFKGCSDLTNIRIPLNVTYLYDETFRGCKNLTSVTLPDGLQYIGDRVFGYCENLPSIIIPKSVVRIGNGAFVNCSKLSNIYYRGTEAQWNSITKGQAWEPDVFTMHYEYTGN